MTFLNLHPRHNYRCGDPATLSGAQQLSARRRSPRGGGKATIPRWWVENELRARAFRIEFLGHSRGEAVGDPDGSDHAESQDPKHACTLLTDSRDEATDFRESLGGVDLPEANRDLHFNLEHADVPHRTVMGERHLEVPDEMPHFGPVVVQRVP